MAMTYRLVFDNDSALAVNDPWPSKTPDTEGWTVGAMFLVYEELDPGAEEDSVAVTAPSHFRVWGQPPKGRQMADHEPAFYLDIPYSKVKFALATVPWFEAMRQIKELLEMSVDEFEPPAVPVPPAPVPPQPQQAVQQPTG